MDDSDANPTDDPASGVEFELSILDEFARTRIPTGSPLATRSTPSPPGARLSVFRRLLAGLVALVSTLLAITILVASIPSADASIRQALHAEPTPCSWRIAFRGVG
jgi:hypothetical protein